MDKFIIRSPRNSPNSSPKKVKSGLLKQMKIEALLGVVVIEELERGKIILDCQDTTVKQKVTTLKDLSKRNPAREILIKTGIGKSVHKLCKHEHPGVASEAQKIYKTWKNNILSKVDKPMIEVDCDLKTKNFREKARQMIFHSLNAEVLTHSEIDNSKQTLNSLKKKQINKNNVTKEIILQFSEYIERELFKVTNRLINNSYKRTVRKLVMTLKHQTDIQQSVIKSKLSIEKLVHTYLQL